MGKDVLEMEKFIKEVRKELGVVFLIAIKKIVFGIAAGGNRFWNYPSLEIAEVSCKRHASEMSLKAASTYSEDLEYVPTDGGKMFTVGDPNVTGERRKEIYRVAAQIVDSLGGIFFTGGDVNTSEADTNVMAGVTPYIMGGSKFSKNPAFPTAIGTIESLRAVAEFSNLNLSTQKIKLQGAGAVGGNLIYLLSGKIRQGNFCFSELDEKKMLSILKQYPKINNVGVEDIYDLPGQVFIPAALEDTVNEENIKKLHESGCKIICGPANCQLKALTLKEMHHLTDLMKNLGLIYIPGFVASSGGLLNVFHEWKYREKYNYQKALKDVYRIGDRTWEILEKARRKKTTPFNIAYLEAEERLGRAQRQQKSNH